MNTALKEWASVVAALGTGRQIVLLLKGGIVGAERGFEPLHPDFLPFPTFEHQQEASLKLEFQGLPYPPAGDGIHIEFLARVTSIFAPTNLFLPLTSVPGTCLSSGATLRHSEPPLVCGL